MGIIIYRCGPVWLLKAFCAGLSDDKWTKWNKRALCPPTPDNPIDHSGWNLGGFCSSCVPDMKCWLDKDPTEMTGSWLFDCCLVCGPVHRWNWCEGLRTDWTMDRVYAGWKERHMCPVSARPLSLTTTFP